MVSRSDVQIAWNLSPRLIFVDEPSTEISIQDLHDTLRDREQEPANIVYPKIIDSAGKEDLGSGISVGVTSTLQNARIGFQARKVWVSVGTVTSTETAGIILNDNTATFQTDGVVPGSWIVNTTDGSIATILTIDSEIQLSTDMLGGGANNQFNINDLYRIMNVTQVEVSGGNLVAVDGYNATIDAIFPTAGTQAVRTSASSSTTQSQAQLEHSTFNGVVTVDTANGISGTTYPIGTQQQPVNNITDARAIAVFRGFITFRIKGNATFDTGDDISGFIVFGENPAKSLITINDGASTQNVEMSNATVTGVFDTEASFNRCNLINIQFVESTIQDCVLEGVITLDGTGSTSLYNCNDGLILNSPPPAIDFNGSGRSLAIRNYNGDIELRNKTGNENVEININSGGRITIASSVTGGNIRLTGILEVDDNSIGANIDISQVIYPEFVQLAAYGGMIHINTNTGVIGTKFPIGTEQNPVNNLDDAIIISTARNIPVFRLHGTLLVSNTSIIDGYTFLGANPLTSIISLQDGCSTIKTEFKDTILTGTVNGPILCENVALQALSGIGSDTFPTIFDRCIFRLGDQVLKNGLITPQNIHFIDCFSGIPGDGYATIDFNGSDSPVAFRKYSGGLGLSNYTGGQTTTFSFEDGILNLNSTNTNGIINLDGIVALNDQSGPGLVVVERSSINSYGISKQVWDTLIADHVDTTTFGGYIGNKLLSVGRFLALGG